MNTYTLRIVSIKSETENASTFIFRQPLFKKIKYIAGQYITVSFRINGRKYNRPYSLSSYPEIKDTLAITVKRLKGGIVSNFMLDNLKIGDVVEVLEPTGDFIIKDGNDDVKKNYFFYAGGSGITPIYSIICGLIHAKTFANLYLYYSNKSIKETIFFKEINELAVNNNENFFVSYRFSNNEEHDKVPASSNIIFEHQRLDNLYLQGTIIQKPVEDSHFFICGSSALQEIIYNFLIGIGISKCKILIEEFQLKKNQEDIANILDQEIIVFSSSQKFCVKVPKGKSILEAILDSGIDMTYSCQTGKCRFCKGQLLSGELQMFNTKSEITNNDGEEWLLCCCYPLSNDVIVQI